MYSIGEKVVYPGQGVAKINRILEKDIAGKQSIFFELKFLNKEMTILVPVDNLTSVGVRKLSSDDHILQIFSILSQPNDKINNYKELSINTWNKRSKQYNGILRTGNLIEISKIYRDLQLIAKQKELSFGEKNLLLQTETLLAQEISLVKNVIHENAISELKSFFNFDSTTLKQSRRQLQI